MRSDGRTAAFIAAKLGISEATVRRYIRQADPTRPLQAANR
jgi:DNA-binding NarL/FixJ family response regulator